ncbi:MAG: 2OG-Fe(II) oxygenase [Arenicellales bacterium]
MSSTKTNDWTWLERPERFVSTAGPALARLAIEKRAEFSSAVPFPHVVIDGLFDEHVLEQVIEVFPDPDSEVWTQWASEHEDKYAASNGDDALPPPIQHFLRYLNSAEFVRFCELVSGVRGLIPDPHFHGAGVTQVLAGGHLNLHEDFNQHRFFGLKRTLSVLIYLNNDWKEEYGGDLELWDAGLQECGKSIAPLFNRTVLFLNVEKAYHGHPKPLRCPPEIRRKSMATIYYTNPQAARQQRDYHPPLFQSPKG